jgi:putative membrane protein
MVTSILSEADAREVEAAIGRVEAQTSAEVVVAVVPQSAEYWRGRVLLAAAWAVAAGFAFLWFEPWAEPALALLVEVVVGLLAYALAGSPGLGRALISRRAAERAVQARALQLFAERGLHGTRGRTALLIFVSELEHRVVLLGDRSLNDELGQQGWDAQVELLLGHIKAGHARQGLLEVLEQLAPRLAKLSPRLDDDQNELPDTVLRG